MVEKNLVSQVKDQASKSTQPKRPSRGVLITILTTLAFFLLSNALSAAETSKDYVTRWAAKIKAEHEDRLGEFSRHESKALEAVKKAQDALDLARRLQDEEAAAVAVKAIDIAHKALDRTKEMQQREEARVNALFASESKQMDPDLPLSEPLPEGLSQSQFKALTKKRGDLIEWRRSLVVRTRDQNRDCGEILPKNWALLGQCREVGNLLRQEREEYVKALRYFKDETETALEVGGIAQPAPGLDSKVITYFLWDSEESNQTLLELMTSPALGESEPRPWPGQKASYERLVNPLDESQERQDHELLRPLDHSKIETLPMSAVAQIINARADARVREATRHASSRMHAEIKKLEEEGILRPGESVLAKEQKDPEFRKRLKEILTGISREEIAEIRHARASALDEMRGIADLRERESDAKRQRALYSEQERITTGLERALYEANNQSARDLNRELERLRKEGFYKPDEDLKLKYQTDSRFRKAVNQSIHKVLQSHTKAERQAHDRAFEEMQKAVKDFMGEL